MEPTRKTFAATRSDAERGGLVSALLANAWRTASPAPNFAEAELAEIAPLLSQTGSAALGWWRFRSPTVREGHVRSDSGGAVGAEPSLTVGLLTLDTQSEPAAMLHEAYRRFRLSALVHEQEIKYVFSLLRAEGIEPVLVKGWAIARLYPDRGLRPYGDIDLCVRPDQFAKAERVLKCLESLEGHYVDLHSGFAKLELIRRFSARSRRSLRLGGEPGCQETHRRDAECAEVSWRKTFSRLSHTALWDELFERSQLVSLCSPCPSGEFPANTIHREGTEDTEEVKVRVLSDEDHLRVLCLHLLRSGAWRPLWLCDVAVALESRAANFDWDRCLTSDPKVADWVACTIGLAQQLLGAEVRAKGEEQSAKAERLSASLAQSTSRFALSSLPFARLPRWLAPAVLRQWGRSLNPHALEMALPALSARTNDARKFFKEIYARWDQPVRATVALGGWFNNWPRLPYQLAELILRSSEVPKQFATMLRGQLRNRKERATEAQSYRERNGVDRTNETTGEAREMLRPLPFVS